MSGTGDEATVRVCSSCSSPVRPDDQFCRSCGAALDAEGGATAPFSPAGGDTSPDVEIALGPPGSRPTLPGLPTGSPKASGPYPDTSAKADGATGPPLWKRREAQLIAGGAAVVLLLVLTAIVAFGGDSGGGTTAAPALVNGEPITVDLEGNTADARVHKVRLERGDTVTVFVTGDRRFEPVVEVASPNGDPVSSQSIAVGNNGSATAITASATGQHEVSISNFGDDQTSYEVEERNTTFTAPQNLAVGDCVTRFAGETWARVSGFMIRPCDRSHDGQVFEQVPDFGDNESEAQAQCDTARNQRIRLPGYVQWKAYWGDDLTCIVVRGDGSQQLTRSIVTP